MVAIPHIEKHLQLLESMGLPPESRGAVSASLTKAVLAGMNIPSLAEKGVSGQTPGSNATLPALGDAKKIEL